VSIEFETRGPDEKSIKAMDCGLITKKHRGIFAKFLEILI
jgi:hypothetical protein